MAAATLRRRLIAGDTYRMIAADLGMTAGALRMRCSRLGVTSTKVLGRHRRRPFVKAQELVRRREEKRRAA